MPAPSAAASCSAVDAAAIIPVRDRAVCDLRAEYVEIARKAAGSSYDDFAMPRINWVVDADASGPVASAFAQIRATSQSGGVADILRTMSVRPEFMMAINDASRLHFSDGALSRAQHEMIASYVAALNRCHY